MKKLVNNPLVWLAVFIVSLTLPSIAVFFHNSDSQEPKGPKFIFGQYVQGYQSTFYEHVCPSRGRVKSYTKDNGNFYYEIETNDLDENCPRSYFFDVPEAALILVGAR